MNLSVTLLSILWTVVYSSINPSASAHALGGTSSWHDGDNVTAEASFRSKRTIGSGSDFVNGLAIGESEQRFCSYDPDFLESIFDKAVNGTAESSGVKSERQQQQSRALCPEGRVFYIRCNICRCKAGER
ncbi:uncharacterized protein LOC129758088 [Uranotaenia lowii]|uniref:uncharacterized protein LOC129758088 n=1 Tax=Uranotaenia lowii TaxID=190385 RepID=UPI002478F43E|nr:uncharacterized protein LOC129758088 [Uranotaenia lowii]